MKKAKTKARKEVNMFNFDSKPFSSPFSVFEAAIDCIYFFGIEKRASLISTLTSIFEI